MSGQGGDGQPESTGFRLPRRFDGDIQGWISYGQGMKKQLLMMAIGALLPSLGFGEDAVGNKLGVGSEVTPEVFGKLEWIQGEGPKQWEDGKVYVFECWATWCGPCIAAIPHINELHEKYEDSGLRVFGIDVWEDGKEQGGRLCEEEGQGDGLSRCLHRQGWGV